MGRAADRRKRVCRFGRCGDRDAARRRSSGRNEDGPSRGCAARPCLGQGLCHADEQHEARGRGRRQSAREERLRPHHRDSRDGRRFRVHHGPMGGSPEMRRSVGGRGRSLVLVSHERERLVRHAGQLRARFGGAALGRDGRKFPEVDGAHGRTLGRRYRGSGAGDLQAVLPRSGGRRALRSLVHAGRPDRFRRGPAPR